MKTKLIKIKSEEDFSLMDEAAKALRTGELVAFPTETVYGLGANAKDKEAVKEIFKAKGRPSDNPLIVHIYDKSQVDELAEEVSPFALKVMEKFWPGPITVIVKRKKDVPDVVTAGLDTVALRMPENDIALAFLKKAGVPVAAPSANTSGRPSPTEAAHVVCDMEGKIPYIIDGGASKVGLESTVLDTTEDIPKILRPGGVTKKQLEEVLGKVSYDSALSDDTKTPKAPGMKYQHYSPKAELTVVEGENAYDEAKRLANEAFLNGKKAGLICAKKTVDDNLLVIDCGDNAKEYAARLFYALRKMDELGAEIIYAELPFDGEGIEIAIRNRIYKAAAGRVVKCQKLSE